MLAVQMRVYEGIVDRRDVDLVGDLVALDVLVAALLVMPVGIMGFRVQSLPREMLSKAIHDPVARIMLGIVRMAVARMR